MSDSSDPQARVRMQWAVKIPMRDGVHLNATVYRPMMQTAPMPTIFTLTPYISQTYHDVAMYFAMHDYPFLTIDVRGRGNSEGVFRPLINEAKDAFDVIEWLARQPYCSGQVSMWGGSYSGYVQWAVAKEFPIHLASIAPVASPYIGADFPIRNNIAGTYLMQWLTLVWGRTSQDKIFWDGERYWGALFRRWFESGAAFRELDAQLGSPSATFQEWTTHPEQGQYWDTYNPSAQQYGRISIPVLTITGIYDGDQIGALTHYREHLRNNTSVDRQPHFLIIGPWDHSGTRTPAAKFCGLSVGSASLLDLLKLHLEWYDWTMRDGPRPQFLRANVAYYVMGADKWRYADSLEQVTLHTLPLYLCSDGKADDVFKSGVLRTTTGRSSGPDSYAYDPSDVSLASLESTIDPENRVDQRMVYASSGRHLIYHSEPLTEDLEISGFFKLSVWLSIDQPDTDFRASIYEVALDGSAVQLSVDSLRARYREGLRSAKLITTSEPLNYDFEQFTFTSRQVRRGSRLRLVIGCINSIYSQKNYNTGGVISEESMCDARTVTVRLFHDVEHPSVLHVPLGARDDAD